MKKVTLFFALLLGMFLFPSVETHAAEPRVMAYDLHLDPTAPAGFVRFCYTLNTAAEHVYVVMYAPNGEVAMRRELTSSSFKTKGEHKWTIAQFDLPSFKGMTWAIEAQGTAITTLVCTNDVSGSTTKYQFFRPQGVAVDNNPESDFFGRMYITLPRGGYDHTKGIVVFDPVHNVLSNDGITASGVVLGTNDTYAMHRIAVNPTNNKVYYTKSEDPTAIYELTPDATSILSDGGTAKNIISGLGFTRADGICFDENGTLFVMDYASYSSGSQGDIYKVKGNEKTLFCENIGANQPNSLAYDGDGGVWMVQQRGTVGNPYPLAHINKNGEVDFKLTANTNNWFPTANITKGGSVAYDVKNQVVAMGGAGTVLLFQVKMVDGKPTLEKKIGEHVFKTGGTAEVNGLAFDYAGNLIALSKTSEFLYHYAVPTDNNTCITPAKKSSTFDGAPVARVFAYGLNVVDNGNSYTFSFTPNASATTGRIVVYNGETKAQVAEFAISAPLTKGVKKEVTINKEDLPKLLGMTWAVELSGKAVESISVLHNYDDVAKYGFNRPQDVAIDNNPESDFFGRMYIALPKAGGTSYSDAQAGIVVFDPLHKRLASGLKATGVALGSNDRLGMHRIAVNPLNNKVYYAKSESSTAVYELTPDATNILSDGGTAKNAISGISAITNANSLCFDAEGAMYVMDNAASGTGIIYKVSNGVAEEWKKTTGYLWGNADNALASDGRGGIWVAIQRYTLDNCYSLSHVNKNKEIDFKLSKSSSDALKALFPDDSNAFSRRGHVAYNPKDDILAFGTNRSVALFKVTYGTSDISLELIGRTPTITKTEANIDGLAFDYAGNLVVLSATSERFYHYAVPTANNICLVPAKSTLTIDGEVGEVTYKLNGGVWNEYGWNSKKDMYDAFISEWKAYEGPDATNRTTVSYDEQLGIGKSNGGIPTTIGTAALRDNLPAMFMHNDYSAKWGWLAKYMDVVAATQYKKMNAANGSKVQPTTNGAALTFSLGNFFGEDNNHTTDYIDAVDFTGEEAHLAAFQSVWGQTFPCVANPTEEITLNIPYKKGYRFDGWYKESDFSGSPVTKVDNTFKGTLYAKWTQSGIVYELNGGVWNQYGWESKKDMYDAFLADWKAYSGSTRGTIPYEDQFGIGKSNAGIPVTIQESEDLLGFMAQEKWAWLGQFLDALATAQGKATMPTEAIKQMRFGLGNFFGEDNNQATNWVGAVDCSGDIASITAFAPYWGQTFPLPTQPTEEVTLTAPYKEDYIFDGWYAAADFSGAKVTKVNATSTGTLYAKWSVAPLYYELNGGVWNQYGWTSKKDMYDAFIADWKAYSGSTQYFCSYETQLGIGNSNQGLPTAILGTQPILEFMAQDKWAWLGQFLDALATAQGKATMPTANGIQMRWGLGNFFGEDNNGSTTWHGAVDCSAGQANPEAFQPTWGQSLPHPIQPTTTVVLGNPYKEGYLFGGWYATSTFIGAEVLTVDENTNGTLYAKWLEHRYTRDVTNGRYGTICLPYGSTNMIGATFYEVAWMNTAVSPWKVYVDEVTELEAGKPYIFKATSSQIVVAYKGEEAQEAGNYKGLYGTFDNIIDGDAGTVGNILENNHMLSNNQIMKCLGNCQLLANRAYFKLGEIPTVEPALVPGRRRVALGVQGGNEATGLDNLTEDGVAPAMEGTYDVLGRKMTEPTNNGFYIVNGKKVVVLK